MAVMSTDAAPGPATSTEWSMRKVALVAVAAVALSGIGGAALAAVSDGVSTDGRAGGFGGPPGFGRQASGQQNTPGNGGFNGQVQAQVQGQVQGRPPGV